MKQSAVEFLVEEINKLNLSTEARAFINKLQKQAKEIEKEQQGYSEEDMKQFAFVCVANFLSNNNNKVEMSLVEVITDRNDEKFEQFKKK